MPNLDSPCLAPQQESQRNVCCLLHAEHEVLQVRRQHEVSQRNRAAFSMPNLSKLKFGASSMLQRNTRITSTPNLKHLKFGANMTIPWRNHVAPFTPNLKFLKFGVNSSNPSGPRFVPKAARIN
ncbi:uncharacterized protein DS421_3g82460 [Arachis hypogaea]|nr:uncharacterized protein DS421_3g82460 [Arachis hypogaea]